MNWRLISIGKQFFHIILRSDTDLQAIWSRGSINLHPRILFLMPWTPGFDPSAQKTTSMQVWVQIYNLLLEFLDKQILSDIARSIGIPLKIDSQTLDGEFGHFARVLVDIDLLKPIQETVRADTDDSKVWVFLKQEELPKLCTTCQAIGYSSAQCRRNKRPEDLQENTMRQAGKNVTRETS